MSRTLLANTVFPDITKTITDLRTQYPERDTSQTPVSRFAPSPTGSLHIWWVYAALVSSLFVSQKNGTYFLRLEDTDQERVVEWSLESMIQGMKMFDMDINEWPIWPDNSDVGDYGPYVQSHRMHLYSVFAKHLLAQWKAYLCWMTSEELEGIRDGQMRAKKTPWIYGNYSKFRDLSPEEQLEKYATDTNCVVRLRSHGDTTKKIFFDDVLRWKVTMIDNFNDIVLIKSGGLPTYHLAHICDDYLMGTTHVIRAEERLTSVPLHLQLFAAFELPAPAYAHLAQILKKDEETWKKRKLAKRKDPETDYRFLIQQWYPVEAIKHYLMTIIDSKYEDWFVQNPTASYKTYEFELTNMNTSGALLDMDKLKHISNIYLSALSHESLYELTLARSKDNNTEMHTHMTKNPEYALAAMSIERLTEKDPKRFNTLEDVWPQIHFFFDDVSSQKEDSDLPESFDSELAGSFLAEYVQTLDYDVDTMTRFWQLKEIAQKYGFAANNKEYKQGWFRGKVWDIAMLLRFKLAKQKHTPDLWSMMKVMWKERVEKRLG